MSSFLNSRLVLLVFALLILEAQMFMMFAFQEKRLYLLALVLRIGGLAVYFAVKVQYCFRFFYRYSTVSPS
jgi:hypothetical protein